MCAPTHTCTAPCLAFRLRQWQVHWTCKHMMRQWLGTRRHSCACSFSTCERVGARVCLFVCLFVCLLACASLGASLDEVACGTAGGWMPLGHARLAAEALDKGDLDLLLGHITQHCEWKARHWPARSCQRCQRDATHNIHAAAAVVIAALRVSYGCSSPACLPQPRRLQHAEPTHIDPTFRGGTRLRQRQRIGRLFAPLNPPKNPISARVMCGGNGCRATLGKCLRSASGYLHSSKGIITLGAMCAVASKRCSP
jgi:hypothetical protein